MKSKGQRKFDRAKAYVERMASSMNEAADEYASKETDDYVANAVSRDLRSRAGAFQAVADYMNEIETQEWI